MAYLSNERLSEIRTALKASFPEIKFSIRNENHSTASVSILESPYDFKIQEGRKYEQINHYYPQNHANTELLKRIIAVCMTGNFDNSDLMADYVHVGWYLNLSVGQWDKPYKMNESLKAKALPVAKPKFRYNYQAAEWVQVA